MWKEVSKVSIFGGSYYLVCWSLVPNMIDHSIFLSLVLGSFIRFSSKKLLFRIRFILIQKSKFFIFPHLSSIWIIKDFFTISISSLCIVYFNLVTLIAMLQFVFQVFFHIEYHFVAQDIYLTTAISPNSIFLPFW